MVRFHRTPLWCIFLSWEGQPQQGLHSSISQNTALVQFSDMGRATSTRIAQLDLTEHHSGAFLCHGKVNLNRDCIARFHRTPLWCISLAWEGGPQQGLHGSISQNTTLVHFSVMGRSTSTGIAHFGRTEHQSGTFFKTDRHIQT